MARHWFGNTVADWTFTRVDDVDGHDNIAQLVGAATVTFWNERQDGTQYTDLLDAEGQPITQVVTGDAGDELGVIPLFQGPDDVTYMWAEADGGPRVLVQTWDLGDQDASQVQEQLSTHQNATNPHALKLVHLVDVALGGAADGQVPAWNATLALWVATSVDGVTGVVTLANPQTITGAKTFVPADPATTPITVQAAAGQTADLVRVLSGLGLEVIRVGLQGNLLLEALVGQIGLRVKARSGQTARLLEVVDDTDQPIAWVETDGRIRAPNLGHVFPFSVAGPLSPVTGRMRLYNDTGRDLTLRSVRATVGVAPTGDDIVVDVLRDGTSIFASAGSQPTITDGALTSGRVDNIDTTTVFANGSYLTVDIDQVGSANPGEDLTVQVQAY